MLARAGDTKPGSRDADAKPQPVGARCFLAVPLADPGLAAAQRLQVGLRERVEGVRWARPETLHLTVALLRRHRRGRAAAALEVVQPIATQIAPFDVLLDQLGAFPSSRNASRALARPRR